MDLSTLSAISPVDGRYADKTAELRDIFSEFGLIRHRVLVEIRWYQHLAAEDGITELPPLPKNLNGVLESLITDFEISHAQRVKKIESGINHDVKAVEYFLKEHLKTAGHGGAAAEFIHFGCSSEDINNLAYALMLSEARERNLIPAATEVGNHLAKAAHQYATQPMMSRTHGQTASPTTVGKELANFAYRLKQQRQSFAAVRVHGKMNGAVGNFNAHVSAYPDVDWEDISERFVHSLNLEWHPFTTQIEPHDWMAEYSHALIRLNTVLVDMARDFWGYISLGYFTQRANDTEVGSSTMPHKVNPIDFENAEGNLGVANALLDHFATKLPISRWQRDLSDSTVQRNFGFALSLCLIAYQSLLKGLDQLAIDKDRLAADLDDAWEVLSEPIQTVMRRYGIEKPYEQLKSLTRGQKVDKKLVRRFIEQLDIPADAKARLLELTPASYLGTAARRAGKV